MAQANKCDRCWKLYERSTSSDKYAIRKNSPYATKDVDLCVVCQKELENFKEPRNYVVVDFSDIERGETND